ncbi:MAG TPA: TIGR02117 family protein [Candidatus Competibacteraceae bacterium]|nr:TIGR02117 family protein [Candidatus Competibacteraceae bacterium]
MYRSTDIGLSLALALFAGCATPSPGLFPPRADQPHVPMLVVSHGWHTGLVLPRAALRPHLPALSGAFEDASWLEIGWGDAGFYPAEKITLGLALGALFGQHGSVLHVVAVPDDPDAYFTYSERVHLEISSAGLAALARFIDASFARDAAGRSLPLGAGLYGDSRFYRSREDYHMFNTCNAWTARALRQAGLPVAPALTAGGLLREVRRLQARAPAPSPLRLDSR